MERLQTAAPRVRVSDSRQEQQFGNVVAPVDGWRRALAMTAVGFSVAFVVDMLVSDQSLLMKLARLIA